MPTPQTDDVEGCEDVEVEVITRICPANIRMLDDTPTQPKEFSKERSIAFDYFAGDGRVNVQGKVSGQVMRLQCCGGKDCGRSHI